MDHSVQPPSDYEFAPLMEELGCDVRTYTPQNLLDHDLYLKEKEMEGKLLNLEKRDLSPYLIGCKNNVFLMLCHS